MSDLPLQIFAMLILLAVIGGGYWRWVRPHAISLQARGLLVLMILTMAGGLIGSLGWWTDNPSAFSWDLPPLASRMLGAAGWAFGVATFLTLQRPTWLRLRLVLLMLVVYLLPLAIAIFLFHMGRFDFSAPISYAFFAIVGIMIVASLWYLYRRPTVIAEETENPTASPSGLRVWLMIALVVTGLWGAALFITDQGGLGLIWVWPGDLLSSRLIAVMLLTMTTAALYSLRYPSTAQVTLSVMVVYGFGAALANLLNIAAGKPVQMLYVLAFGLIGVVSVTLLTQRRSRMPALA